MERPSELIRRASRRESVLPAMKEGRGGERERREEEGWENLPPPQPVSRHDSYSALMRSHDRVHTRHIK